MCRSLATPFSQTVLYIAAVQPHFHEWFTRGLVEGQHYLEVPAEPLDAICPALVDGMLSIEGRGARPAARRLVSASQTSLTITSTDVLVKNLTNIKRMITMIAV